MVDGVRAGNVDKVTWIGTNQVLVRLQITHPHMIIPLGSKFTILANALVGARYMDIALPNTGEEDQKPIPESTIVTGGDTLRPEIILNKVGGDLDQIDMAAIKRNLSEDDKVLRKAASQFSILADKTMPVMEKALPLENNLMVVSNDLSITTKRLNKFIDNPKLSPELRETVRDAKETAQIAQKAIGDLNKTLTDKSLRQDLLDTMHQLNQSTCLLEQSMEKLQGITQDVHFREDMKEILLQARQALERLDKLLNDPNSGSDVRSTLKDTRTTLEDVDLAARQLQQILSKRQPLIHMFLGRPGYIKKEDATKAQP